MPTADPGPLADELSSEAKDFPGKKDFYLVSMGFGVAAVLFAAGWPKIEAKVRLSKVENTHFYKLTMIYYKVINVEKLKLITSS